MAGVDKEHLACSPDGIRIGYLPQEPQLDPNKTVREPWIAVHDPHDCAPLRGDRQPPGQDPPDMDKFGGVLWSCKTRSRRAAHGPIVPWSARWILRLLPEDARCDKLSGGEEARRACKLLESRTLPRESPPTTSTRNRWRGSSATPRLPGHRRRRHPRSLFPRQRRGLILVRSRQRHPHEGNYRAGLSKEEAPWKARYRSSVRGCRRRRARAGVVRMAPRASQA